MTLSRYYTKRIDHPQYLKLYRAIMGVTKDWTPRWEYKRVCDIGCAVGELLRYFPEGWFRCGCDYNLEAGEYAVDTYKINQFHQVDMEKSYETQWPAPPQFNLITCMEVAEHISNWGNLLDFIQEISRDVSDRTTLVWSAAVPGQPGKGHINCQTPEWWMERMTERGWWLDQPATDHFVASISANKHVNACYRNTRIYRKGKA